MALAFVRQSLFGRASATLRIAPAECSLASAVRHASSSARPVPPPRGTLASPADFLAAVSRPRRDLASNSSCVSAVGEDWEGMFKLSSEELKKKGVAAGERKYLLWALEKYRQGLDPANFALAVKPKKKVRGWGPRVQNGIRVRGRRRPGEK